MGSSASHAGAWRSQRGRRQSLSPTNRPTPCFCHAGAWRSQAGRRSPDCKPARKVCHIVIFRPGSPVTGQVVPGSARLQPGTQKTIIGGQTSSWPLASTARSALLLAGGWPVSSRTQSAQLLSVGLLNAAYLLPCSRWSQVRQAQATGWVEPPSRVLSATERLRAFDAGWRDGFHGHAMRAANTPGACHAGAWRSQGGRRYASRGFYGG
jgi:hypothetical protein